MSGGDLNRIVEARAFDDVEAAHLFFGFGERAIGDQHFAAADADGGGIAAWPEPRAAVPAAMAAHRRPRVRAAVWLGRCLLAIASAAGFSRSACA
jgi:hypothetical protein